MRLFLLLPLVLSCDPGNSAAISAAAQPPSTIRDFPLPSGFIRMALPQGSFGEWLRGVRLKKDNTVYLYNGRPKSNQHAQVAVLDVSVGTKDLQQCADAMMRLRAEYLYATGAEDKIIFHATDGTLLDYASFKKGYRFQPVGRNLYRQLIAKPTATRKTFDAYLALVFSYCGTASLEKEMRSLPLGKVMPGDVLIHGGSPGHAVIVMDVILDKNKRKNILIAQSYMPAQDIHVLRNPMATGDNPWYDLPSGQDLYTPEWQFSVRECKRFAEGSDD